MKVAITGNIGSGKSYVCSFFKAIGIPVFDSDFEAKQLYALPEIKQRITERFGEEMYLPDGSLDRKRLAGVLFSDPCALGYVESILYPVLNDYFDTWAASQEAPYVLYESALIFEKHLEAMFDAIIVVSASEETRIRRVMVRDHCAEEQVRGRMTYQLPQSEKLMKADYVIVHEQDDEDDFLREQVSQIHNELLKRG